MGQRFDALTGHLIDIGGSQCYDDTRICLLKTEENREKIKKKTARKKQKEEVQYVPCNEYSEIFDSRRRRHPHNRVF